MSYDNISILTFLHTMLKKQKVPTIKYFFIASQHYATFMILFTTISFHIFFLSDKICCI